jgi:hypothetical protein
MALKRTGSPGYLIARVIAAALLVWAIYPHHRGYYTLLRWVTASVLAYGASLAVLQKKSGWAWTFGVLAVVFNPVVPVYIRSKMAWTWIDIGTAVVILISTVLTGVEPNWLGRRKRKNEIKRREANHSAAHILEEVFGGRRVVRPRPDWYYGCEECDALRAERKALGLPARPDIWVAREKHSAFLQDPEFAGVEPCAHPAEPEQPDQEADAAAKSADAGAAAYIAWRSKSGGLPKAQEAVARRAAAQKAQEAGEAAAYDAWIDGRIEEMRTWTPEMWIEEAEKREWAESNDRGPVTDATKRYRAESDAACQERFGMTFRELLAQQRAGEDDPDDLLQRVIDGLARRRVTELRALPPEKWEEDAESQRYAESREDCPDSTKRFWAAVDVVCHEEFGMTFKEVLAQLKKSPRDVS